MLCLGDAVPLLQSQELPLALGLLHSTAHLPAEVSEWWRWEGMRMQRERWTGDCAK